MLTARIVVYYHNRGMPLLDNKVLIVSIPVQGTPRFQPVDKIIPGRLDDSFYKGYVYVNS